MQQIYDGDAADLDTFSHSSQASVLKCESS